MAPATGCSHPLHSALLLKGKGQRRQVRGCPPPLARQRQVSTGEETWGRRAAPTLRCRGRWPPLHPTPRSPLTGTAARESAGKLGTPAPTPTIPRLGDLALLRSGGRGVEEEEAPRGSFATQPEALGPRRPALWAWGCRPRARRDPAPPPRRGAQGAAGASRGAEGSARLGRGPAADRGHLRVLLGEAVG